MWYWFPNNQVFSKKNREKTLLFFDEEFMESKDWWVAQSHYTSTIHVCVVAAIFYLPLSLESQYLDMSPVSMKSYIYIYKIKVGFKNVIASIGCTELQQFFR